MAAGDRELDVSPVLSAAPVRDQQNVYKMLATCIQVASSGIPTTLVDSEGQAVARIVPPAKDD